MICHFKQILPGMVISLALVGCGGDSDALAPPTGPETIEQAMEELVSSGVIPELDKTDSLNGTDDDHSGVRDDIEAYIEKLPITDIEKDRLNEVAKTYQSIMVMDLTVDANVRAISESETNRLICAYKTFDDFNEAKIYTDRIVNFTRNTKIRSQKMEDYFLAMDGSVTRINFDVDCGEVAK